MPASTSDIWDALARQELCPPELIEALRSSAEADGNDTPAALVMWLVMQHVVTPYQGDALLKPGENPLRVGHYEITERIHRGRLAGRFRARHHKMQFPVGMKLLDAKACPSERDPRLVRFQRESRISVQVDHPNVLRTYQIGRVGDYYFIAFENLHGNSLHDILADRGLAMTLVRPPLTLWDETRRATRPSSACRLFRDVALGLAHLHSLDIVHRNLTPRNIWITEDGHAKIIGFGLARDALDFLDAPQTDDWALEGSHVQEDAAYMSPEQNVDRTKANPASDLYSLGSSLYHLLTGFSPFAALIPSGKSHTLPPPSHYNPAVSPQLDEVVGRLMSRDAAERFESATIAAEALEQCLDQQEHVLAFEQPQPSVSELIAYLNWLKSDEASQFEPQLWAPTLEERVSDSTSVLDDGDKGT